jgi:hypothetical protein
MEIYGYKHGFSDVIANPIVWISLFFSSVNVNYVKLFWLFYVSLNSSGVKDFERGILQG